MFPIKVIDEGEKIPWGYRVFRVHMDESYVFAGHRCRWDCAPFGFHWILGTIWRIYVWTYKYRTNWLEKHDLQIKSAESGRIQAYFRERTGMSIFDAMNVLAKHKDKILLYKSPSDIMISGRKAK